jgi:hypothetical protein
MAVTNWPVYEESAVPGILKQMDNTMKLAILDDYSHGYTPEEVRIHLRIPIGWITPLFDVLRRLNRDSILVIRGEYIEVPGDPPTYNTIPSSQANLLIYMQDLYVAELAGNEVQKAITEMVQWSNGVGNANYTYWKDKVTA